MPKHRFFLFFYLYFFLFFLLNLFLIYFYFLTRKYAIIIANPIADSAPATAIIYNPNTSANTSLNCQEKNNVITETANKIISIDIIINIKLFLLNINPIAPKPNNTIAKSILIIIL